MFTITEILVFGMAVWRISSLFVMEDGPFFIFKKVRDWAGIMEYDFGQRIVPDNFLAQVLSCVWCTSVWVSGGVTILTLLFPLFSYKIAVIFAFSAIAIIIDTYIQRKK